MKRKIRSLRWILLAVGISAVVVLTGMNVYSLYTLRNSSIESERKSKKIQVAEFADRMRYRFFQPFNSLANEQMENLEMTFNQTGQFPDKTQNIFSEASKDSIFKNIYYIPANSDACIHQGNILMFNAENRRFIPDSNYPSVVCDAIAIAKTRINALIPDYRYNNKTLFDTQRSMVIALINQNKQEVFGYLAMPINQHFMVDNYLQPKLEEIFGTKAQMGFNVWLRDWTNRKVIASSNPQRQFNMDNIEFIQRFPDLFNDWRLYASFDENFVVSSSKPSLASNLIMLGAAFIFLVGAMIFMFFAAQRERALAKRQSGFLANVTHELKTPLAVMQAAGENLADGRVDDQERLKSYGSHIYSEAVRLRKMIEKLLDVAKADAGQSFVHPKPVAIGKLVNKFIEEHQSYIKDKGFELDYKVPKHLPNVMLDEHSFNTILSNLANNAIKYSTDKKFIGIYLSLKGKDVILQVKDHGTGISKKNINHIFEKFYRAEDTLTAQTKGYGLGLSIVENLVDLNGGTISVTSQVEKGSSFTVTFPSIDGTVKTTYQHEDTNKTFKTSKKSTPNYVK